MKTLLSASALLALLATASWSGMFPEHPFSDDARGTTSASFLKSPASARFAALGQGAAALRSPDALFFNPAGASYLPAGSAALLLGYESLLEDAGRGAVAGLRGFAGGVAGFGALYRYDGGMKKYDMYGQPAGSFGAHDTALTGFYGVTSGRVDIGAALKYINSTLDNRSANSAAVDLGVIINDRTARGMQVAFFARNLGSPMKLGTERAPLPFELGGGLGWNYLPGLGLYVDARMPSDHAPYIILSGEYAVPFDGASGLFLRTGLNFRNSDDLGMLGVLTCGFGLKLGSVAVDYAFVPYGDLGSTHRVTLSRGFGPGALPSPRKLPRKMGLAGQKPSLAVAALEAAPGVGEVMATQVTDMIETELARKGDFRVLERTRPDYISAEKKLYYAGMANKERSLVLARRLGARCVLFGGVARIPKGYMVEVKLALADTGEIIAGETAEAEDDFMLPAAARELAAAVSTHL